MLALREFRNGFRGLPDVLDFGLMPEDGIVQTKSGGLMASWYFRGQDTHSATHAELASISARLNAVLCRFGDGWMMHCDEIRQEANAYPEQGAFPDRTSLVIDEERRQQFLSEGTHYEGFYALTLTYHPPRLIKRKVADFMYEGMGEGAVGGVADRILEHFKRVCNDFESVFSGLFPARRMRGVAGKDEFGRDYVIDDQLQYLEYCVSGIKRPVKLPSVPMYLDAIIGAHPFIPGIVPQVGNKYIKVIALDGFPQDSYPSILGALDDLAIEYRWSTRFIFKETYSARQQLEKIRKKWSQKQRGLKDQVLNTSKGVVDLDAVRMTADVEEAIGEAESNLVKFGYYTSVVVLMDSDLEKIKENARAVVKVVMNCGYGAREEEENAIEAYLGSIPGNHHANVRRPMMHSLNLADMLPITSIWAGEEFNPCRYFPRKSPALAYAATTGATPFRINLHVGDAGHALLLGKTRAGKSTALAFMCAQWLRYPGSQVFAFDKGYSLYVLTKACGGQHYDLGGERSELQFCPLAEIDSDVEQAQAAEWLQGCMEMQGVDMTGERKNHLREKILLLSADSGGDRSLTKFQSLLQDREMREALTPYTLKGPVGHLLDGRENTIKYSRFVTFELDSLMKMGEANYAPILLYLFNQIEKRLTGAPTLVPVDEAWMAFKIGIFLEKLDEWPRTWAKKVASLVLATQNMDDALKSALAPVLLQNFPTKIFLPNKAATQETFLPLYKAFGMNNREIEAIANATPQRHYYYYSDIGRRMFEFGFGNVTLSFVGVGGLDDVKRCDEYIAQYGEHWPAEWLRGRGLAEWADYWYKVRV